MWAEATLATTRPGHKAFCQPSKLSPSLSLGLTVRFSASLGDGGSSWRKGPGPLTHCIEEVAPGALPRQGCSRGPRVSTWDLLHLLATHPDLFIIIIFTRAILVLVVFKSMFWFTRKTLGSCYLWKENTFEQSTDNIFRDSIQHSAGWSIFRRIYISSKNQDTCFKL